MTDDEATRDDAAGADGDPADEAADAGAGEDTTGQVVERPLAEVAARVRTRQELKRRVLVPLLVPLLSIAMVGLLAINISRVFLAGGKTGALVAASVVTIGILAGAAYVSARPRLRSSSLTVITSAVVLLAVGAGLTTLGAAGEHGEGGGGGYQPPEGEPTSTVTVAALVTNDFEPTNPTTPAGIIEIDLTCDSCGSHTFLFDDSEYAGFELAVPDGKTTEKAELPEGAYVFYCNIPGHREQGMEGTLTVTAAAPTAESTTTSAPAG